MMRLTTMNHKRGPTEIALLVAGSTFNMQKDHLEKYMDVLMSYLSIQIVK